MTDEKHDVETRAALLEMSIGRIHGDLKEIKDVMRNVAQSLERLARIEERQQHANEALGRAFAEIGDHEKRIKAVEVQIPEIVTVKQWVLRWFLGIASLVGAGVAGAILVR